MSILNIILVSAYALSFCALFILVIKVVFHSYHVFTNVNGKYANVLPFAILLMPSQLNEVGKMHRLQLLQLLPWLVLCLIILVGIKYA